VVPVLLCRNHRKLTTAVGLAISLVQRHLVSLQDTFFLIYCPPTSWFHEAGRWIGSWGVLPNSQPTRHNSLSYTLHRLTKLEQDLTTLFSVIGARCVFTLNDGSQALRNAIRIDGIRTPGQTSSCDMKSQSIVKVVFQTGSKASPRMTY